MSYKVTIQSSGHQFHVERGETVLEGALREKRCVLPYGCRNGTCGTCVGKVLSGEVEYVAGIPAGISAREQAEGKVLFCSVRPRGDLVIDVREVCAAQDIPVKILPSRVVGMQKLASDVMRLYLRLPASDRLQFLAGQYIDILLKDGRRRGFSLANAPHTDEYLELHIRHIPGGEFTTHVFERLREKAILRFEGPLGSFFLREDSPRPIIMMGGGTGFAPLKSMLEHAFHIGVTRPMHLYWGARARQDLYLNELVEAWTEQHDNFRYSPVLSAPLLSDNWQGRTGWVHEAVAVDYPDLSSHELYMSGPPAMIQIAKETFAAQGLPDEHLYYDSFDFAADSIGKV